MKTLLFALALAPLAAAQEMQYELDAPAGVTHYGQAVAALPDIDGDGLPDFALSAFAQRVELHSGASGVLLGLRENATTGYGYVLANAGDTDGDGRADLLVGTPGPFEGDELNPLPTPGFVELLSGADGSLLRRFDEQGGSDDEFGWSLAPLGDIDGDGHADFAIGAPAQAYQAFVPGVDPPGHVYAFSGADGSLLWTAQGLLPRASLGVSLAALPDLDGDGVGELAAGAPGAAASSGTVEPLPEIDLLSGATGAVLRRLLQPDWPGSDYFPNSGFAATLTAVPMPGGEPRLLTGRRPSYWPSWEDTGAVLVDLEGKLLGETGFMGLFDNQHGATVAAGDITGDGLPELFLGSGWAAGLELLNADLSWRNELGTNKFPLFSGTPMPGSTPTACAFLGDVTGDGLGDFVMGESGSGGDTQTYGRVRLFRGGPGPWTNVGGGSAAGLHPPLLFPNLTRTPPTAYSPDSKLRIAVEAKHMSMLSLGRLVVGLQTQNLPLAGGVLVPVPQLSEWFVNFPDDVPLSVDLPASLPSGLTFYVQVGVVSPEGVITLSDAWKGVLP